MNLSERKQLLIVVRRAPYSGGLGRVALETALTAAAFEQPVKLLFLGDGVLQLLPDQAPAAIGVRSVSKLIASLPMYDIDKLYLDQAAAERYGIATDQLPPQAQLLDEAALRRMLTDHDHLLGF